MVSREDVAFDLFLLVFLGNEVSPDDFQPTRSLPDLLPKVSRSMPVRIDWVAGSAIVTEIEGQERGLSTLKFRGHVDFAIADRKVHYCPKWERKQRFWILSFG